MRGALIEAQGSSPVVGDVEGEGPVEVLAVALNPLDLAVAAGRYYGGHPPFPYVPGAEAVGRSDGRRFYMYDGGYGVARNGFLLERTDFPVVHGAPVPDELDDEIAAALGIAGLAAWVPVAWLASVGAGDRVLVLGATGFVGSIAIQAARLLGAERVVAAGRDPGKLERVQGLGADATVQLAGDDLAARMQDACGGGGPTVVIDPIWGEPARAAVDAAVPEARIVNLGQSAGADATLTSAAVRGKRLTIIGHANVAMAPDERTRAYSEIAEHAAAGRIGVEVEAFALEDITDAWNVQAAGRKAVVRL